jgi:hypothetical protein
VLIPLDKLGEQLLIPFLVLSPGTVISQPQVPINPTVKQHKWQNTNQQRHRQRVMNSDISRQKI